MPKATLEFNLPEEEQEFKNATKGNIYYCVLFELDQRLRSILKHGHNYADVETLAEEIRNDIWSVLWEE